MRIDYTFFLFFPHFWYTKFAASWGTWATCNFPCAHLLNTFSTQIYRLSPRKTLTFSASLRADVNV